MRPGLHLNNLGRWMDVLFQFCERRNRMNRWENVRRQHKNVRQDGWPYPHQPYNCLLYCALHACGFLARRFVHMNWLFHKSGEVGPHARLRHKMEKGTSTQQERWNVTTVLLPIKNLANTFDYTQNMGR